ncbi:tudor domain-containing 6 [Leuresthes tenuis]|uniref:tudor domain-containing 6 n=1 Tax=Leuresthes tenuis TaxID=355514 RepID=UPI003B514B24
MSSIPGLPTPGSDVVTLITRVHLHPLCVLVEFWGKFSQERIADYDNLAKDIQSPGTIFKDLEGNPGDQCLVQFDDTWYRSRIVSRNGSKYSVFLIDKGMTHSTTTSKLAWGKKEHFQLPPEVEFCVLANVLPLSPDNRWSAVALEYLKSLTGKSVTAQVQDVLVPHRTFLLHIPCISKQIYEMGFAKKLSPMRFQEFVLMSLNSHSGAEASVEIQQLSKGTGERLQKHELFLYPELPGGTVETVIVTEVTNPQRIFCQLKVFSQELKKLSEQITQSCDGRMSSCTIGREMIGFPCAARGFDGKWYRSVLQQVFPTNKVAEVLNVDYGTKQFVQVENVRPLAAEFFRMPVVTYICSLHGIIDKGVGWTTSQIDFLRSLLLYKRMIAKFEYQSVTEGVYYITLYGDDNTNMNNLFGSKKSCLLESEKALGDYAIQNAAYSCQYPSQQEGKMVTKERKPIAEMFPAEALCLNSSHLAVVHYVSNPSEFWIQTKNYRKELAELLDSIYHLYQDSANKNVVKNPTLGLYCAAKSEDGDFYRATVTKISDTQVKVFFVDYGNSEVVDKSNIRVLPSEFKKLPQLALKCTLAGVRPKDERWSQSASDFFIQAVTDKVLEVHVKAKYNDSYVVQLRDPKEQGEHDVGALMCSSGLAERAEMQRQPKGKSVSQSAIMCPTQRSDARLLDVCRNREISFQSSSTAGHTGKERKVPTFKEHMFPIGSVLDISVSYIESPNDFWCQLVQNAGHLKLLMHDIQAHYAGSEFQPNVEIACIARHPDNRMWYRGLVVHRHETPHVDILFVDYGQTVTISIYDLRRICPEFLTLNGQAFRCSLLNPVDPTSAVNEWNEEAKAKFQNFVETAASNFIILKCTIYAIMYSEQMIVYNIVDLETPFESICTSMANLVTSGPPKMATGPSFRLDTYYYSTHNVKTGTEDQVTVTCVNNVSQFYCHLDKNTDVMKDLKMKVNNLCHQLEKIKLPSVFGTLCFARYTDGKWYRAQIKTTRPSILVHFVDYGDTIEVDKSDLLPVPKEANDIMSVPVQAVMCGLSDVPANVPGEVNSWFETTATECKFRALIVAREPDGKLLVELYHGNTQINAKIKKMFQIEMRSEEQVVHQGWKTFEASANHAQKTPKSFLKPLADTENHKRALKKNNFPAQKPLRQLRLEGISTDVSEQSAQKPAQDVCENGQKIRPALLELYKPPHQRQSCGTMPNDSSKSVGSQVKVRKENQPPHSRQLESKSAGTVSKQESHAEKLPKLSDLPSKHIAPAMTAEVYVSHCDSPLRFYVQCVNEENEIISLVEKLNDPEFTPKVNGVKDVHPGDLIQAEFADDSSWYRAVVKEIHDNGMALIEFVDFGNRAVTPISKIGRLQKSLLELPVYSTHCMLSDAAVLGEERVLDPEVVSAFKEDIGCDGEKVLKCQFVRQVGSVWEVRLEDGGVDVVCKVPAESPETVAEKEATEEPARICGISQEVENSERSQLNPCSLHYQHQEFLVGQQLEVYITTINDAQSFWCQSANSEELDQLAISVAEVGDKSDARHIDPDVFFPGILCIALFDDDQLWYRAEVIDKVGDELSVLFVDYGNKSLVNISDVREMSPPLMDIPPQAFLCELEGFDASCGSWNSCAADELSTLTADKLLQLTVTRATKAEGKIRYCVQMECEGQVINEVMKTWWKCFRTEGTPDRGGLTNSFETLLHLDSIVALLEDQLEYPDIQDVDTRCSTAACIHSQSDHRDDELADPHTGDEYSKLTSSPKSSQECSQDSVPIVSPKQEPISFEGLNILSARLTSPKEHLPCDSGIDETMLLLLDHKDDQGVTVDTDEDTLGTDYLYSPLEEDIAEPMEELENETVDKEEMHLSAHGLDVEHFPDPALVKDDSETVFSRGTSRTAVQMVLRKADRQETTDANLEFSEQAQLLLPSTVHPAQQLCGMQESEAGGGITQGEVPHAPTLTQSDSVREEAASAHHRTHLDLLADTDPSTSEAHSCTVFSPEKGDEVRDLTGDVKEALSADFCTDLEEPLADAKITSARAACLAAEEMTACITISQRDADPEVRDDQSEAEESNEVQNDSVERPPGSRGGVGEVARYDEVPHISVPHERTLGEELTCLVGEICLTDLCRDSQRRAETVSEDSEQQVNPPPQRSKENKEKDLNDSVFSEETSSSAEESFEAQLSKVTHLSLIISDVPADVVAAERQSEE